MKIRKVLCVDMDGTLVVWRAAATEEELTEPGFFFDVPPYPAMLEAAKIIAATRPDIELYVVSAVMDGLDRSISEKQQWLDKYLPEVDRNHRLFTRCGENKAAALADQFDFRHDVMTLLDDYTKNLRGWTEYGGLGIKVYNGVNGTSGAWKGKYVATTMSGQEAASIITAAIDTEAKSKS